MTYEYQESRQQIPTIGFKKAKKGQLRRVLTAQEELKKEDLFP